MNLTLVHGQKKEKELKCGRVLSLSPFPSLFGFKFFLTFFFPKRTQNMDTIKQYVLHAYLTS